MGVSFRRGIYSFSLAFKHAMSDRSSAPFGLTQQSLLLGWNNRKLVVKSSIDLELSVYPSAE
jgi:hypothetical protein